MAENLQIPAEVLVYGASIIHHSKRPLLQNYYNFIKTDEAVTKERDLFLSEPGDPVLTTQFMKTCTGHISLPTMTWI